MDRSRTILLSRNELCGLMRPADYLAAVEAGFRALGEGRAQAPAPLHLQADLGGFHAKGALLQDDRAFAVVKINANFPGNPDRHGLPTIQGVLVLFDAEDGAVLALMDSMEITLGRTAAATALAARFLARPDSEVLAVCGCGSQAPAQIEALAEVLPIRRVLAWDRDARRVRDLARRTLGLTVEAAPRLEAATLQADVIVTCTTAGAPFLDRKHVQPGTFVAAVGADAAAKSEIAPALMAAAEVVCDLTSQCAEMGDLRHALAVGMMSTEDVHAELADLVCGRRGGRTTQDEIALFDSTGVAVQDVASAITAWRRAAAHGIGGSWSPAG